MTGHELTVSLALGGSAVIGAITAWRLTVWPVVQWVIRIGNAALETYRLVQKELAPNSGDSLVDKVNRLTETVCDEKRQTEIWRERHTQAHEEMARGGEPGTPP